MPATWLSSKGLRQRRCSAMWCRNDMTSRCDSTTSSAAVNWPRPAHTRAALAELQSLKTFGLKPE